MTIEEFRNKVMEEIIELKGDKISVCICDTIKNNGVKLHGISLKRKNINMAPTIYIDKYYEKYKTGVAVSYIANKILEEEETSACENDFDTEFFVDFNNVKDKLYTKLINTEKNLEILKEIPHRDFLDLSIVAYCDVTDLCHMNATILIKNQHLKLWEITNEELLEVAYNNTKNNGAVIKDIFECIKVPKEGNMYVMSNNSGWQGAICMTFDDKLDELCEKIGGDIFIIPSSIHEVIIVPQHGVPGNIAYLNNMIKEVNFEHLSAEEILSEHAYSYSPMEGYLIV